MSVHNLQYLFNPKSVAVIGASSTPGRVGNVLMRNIMAGGFDGPVMPVNPKRTSIEGVLTYKDIASLPMAPELAVICTSPERTADFIAELGARGTRAAIVLTAGLASLKRADGRTEMQAMLDAARPNGLRIMGPNCLGLLTSPAKLNASFAHIQALPGRIAFVSQSGALCVAVLDWAHQHGIGFSHFISVGDCADMDFGDALDYLGADSETDAILLYMESIKNARKFMSAARAAARNKPVLAIKAGRFAEGAKAAASHTGAMAGSDEVYEAALRRAGILRVFEIDELFDAVETLARCKPVSGNRVMMLTNGGGLGVMTTDSLVERGGKLAELSPELIASLDKVLPASWSRANPVDIIGDADPARFAAAIKPLLESSDYDSLLLLHVPTAIAPSEETARALVPLLKGKERNVLTSWVGGAGAERARSLFTEAGLAVYDTPDKAVRALMHVVENRRNQEMLMETPASVAEEFEVNASKAKTIIQRALEESREWLTEPEAKDVLAAYGIPVVQTRIANDADEAARIAAEMGGPVAIKILSPEITHKTDVGGVALDLETPEAVRAASVAMLERIRRERPEATLAGFTVQTMARRPRAFELIVGVACDAVFGPAIMFGQGGTAVEVIGDTSLALPPLNMSLAAALIQRTRIAKLLGGFRDHPPADIKAVQLTLVQLSQIVCDHPEVVELDINPLFADERGVLALDARVKVARADSPGARTRLSIRPYPKQLEEPITLKSGRKVLLRPIRPEDEPAHQAYHARLTPEDIHFRFFGLVREFPHSQMARFTQIDYDREMAFIATAPDEQGKPETLGVVRIIGDPDNQRAEFAINVRSDQKGQGLGHILMEKIIRYSRERGTKVMVGEVLSDNRAMLDLAAQLGFKKVSASEGIVRIELPLNPV